MSTGRAVLTVSELTTRLREVLEERFPAVWVEGEISNYRLYGSGHAYFTLKDADAQLRAVLFRNRMRRIRFEPADGLHVMTFGSVEVYPQRGEYQLVVELLEPKGLGALQLAFEQLKARLQAEGLFDSARKRELPRFPRKIGIVTSTSGGQDQRSKPAQLARSPSKSAAGRSAIENATRGPQKITYALVWGTRKAISSQAAPRPMLRPTCRARYWRMGPNLQVLHALCSWPRYL